MFLPKDMNRRSQRGGCIGQEGGVMIVRNTVFFLVKTKEYIIIYTFFPRYTDMTFQRKTE